MPDKMASKTSKTVRHFLFNAQFVDGGGDGKNPDNKELEQSKGSDISPWVNPSLMSEAQRAELVSKVESGEVFSLRFRSVVLGTKENANKIPFSNKQIKELASSSAGKNLLNGHYAFDSGSIVGEVIKGKASSREDGERILITENRLADKAAMIQFARGLWKTFSVSVASPAGWKFNEDTWIEEPLGPLELVHLAFVADPAYGGTGIIDFSRRKEMEEIEKLKAELAKAKSESAAAAAAAEEKHKAELSAERGKRFAIVFSKAVADGRVLPTAEKQFAQVAEALGVETAEQMLGAMAPGVLPTKPVGQAGDETPKSPASGSGRMSAKDCDAEIRKYGLLSARVEEKVFGRT